MRRDRRAEPAWSILPPAFGLMIPGIALPASSLGDDEGLRDAGLTGYDLSGQMHVEPDSEWRAVIGPGGAVSLEHDAMEVNVAVGFEVLPVDLWSWWALGRGHVVVLAYEDVFLAGHVLEEQSPHDPATRRFLDGCRVTTAVVTAKAQDEKP